MGGESRYLLLHFPEVFEKKYLWKLLFRHIHLILACYFKDSAQTISIAEDAAGQNQGGMPEGSVYFAVVEQPLWWLWKTVEVLWM